MLHRSSDVSFLSGSTSYVIGCDEAGRGPLAGPVVAAAVLITDNSFEIDGICDSKATKEGERDELYKVITNPSYADKIIWAAQVIDHKEIDEINILEASLKAMRMAAESVMKQAALRKIKPEQCIGLIDGNKIPANFPCASSFVIKGDSKVYSIAMASIIAKVTRDEIMYELDKQYPIYNLGKHKGYPTAEHRQLLWQHGPSRIHRMSYRPVAEAYEKHGGYTDGDEADVERKSAKSVKRREDSPSSISVTTSSTTGASATTARKKKTAKEVVGIVKSKAAQKPKAKKVESSPASAIGKKATVTKAKTTTKSTAGASNSKTSTTVVRKAAKAANSVTVAAASAVVAPVAASTVVGDGKKKEVTAKGRNNSTVKTKKPQAIKKAAIVSKAKAQKTERAKSTTMKSRSKKI